jgi:hypothetical protein
MEKIKISSEHLNNEEFILPDLWFLQKIINHASKKLSLVCHWGSKQPSFYQTMQNYTLCSSLLVSVICLTKRELLAIMACSYSHTCQIESSWENDWAEISFYSEFIPGYMISHCKPCLRK